MQKLFAGIVIKRYLSAQEYASILYYTFNLKFEKTPFIVVKI